MKKKRKKGKRRERRNGTEEEKGIEWGRVKEKKKKVCKKNL